ncbi:hypothetical protein [Bacillus sp. V5-8f]|uniref:hypothetical protein n=1 Tax=Bacillus sp. V5-8f TaxID=2053044 RepID=UPI000C78D6D1|nr:hypothetical protein [Bacillus sp. V5-8f]PLT32325.1 hypothetical protein CUU64_19700 [Bacillus sp. V5-8f]
MNAWNLKNPSVFYCLNRMLFANVFYRYQMFVIISGEKIKVVNEWRLQNIANAGGATMAQ